MLSIKQETSQSAKWVAVEKFSNKGVNFLFGIFMARLLSPEDFGVLGMITIIFNITTIFIDSGFSTALIRKPEQTEKDYSTVFFFNIFISFIIYGILYLTANYIASFFKMPILGEVLRVQAICLVLNSFASVAVTRLTISLKFKTLAIASLISSILSGGIAIYLALCGYGVWSLVWQNILFSAFNLVIIYIVEKWVPRLIFSFASLKELGGFGIKILATSLIHTVYLEMTSFIIGRFYSAKDLGFYKRGADFAQMPVSAINGVLQKITFPIMAKIQDDRNRLVNVYRKYIKVSSMCIFIFCVIMIALAKPLILSLLGEKWIESVVYLQLFGLAYMFDHISSINLNLLKVVGRSDLLLKLEIFKKTISVIMIISAIPLGILAICIAMLIYSQIAIIINTYYTGKLFNLGYIAQIKDFSKYLISSFIACLPAFLFTFTTINTWALLIAGSILSIVFYLFLLRNDSIMKETLQTIKNKVQGEVL